MQCGEKASHTVRDENHKAIGYICEKCIPEYLKTNKEVNYDS